MFGHNCQDYQSSTQPTHRKNLKQSASLAAEVGFLANRARINVGMTRAKYQLCIVGDCEGVARKNDLLRSLVQYGHTKGVVLPSELFSQYLVPSLMSLMKCPFLISNFYPIYRRLQFSPQLSTKRR